MNLNKKSLLVACVLAAMSTSAFAASTTTSTTSTTVMNQDTPTSTSTKVTREQHILRLYLHLQQQLQKNLQTILAVPLWA